MKPSSLALFFLPLALALAQPGPEKPVALYPGLGIWHHPISTKVPDAQKFFDQGLALLYGFNRYESLRSFRKASELDPQAVMPWWGMAMAQGPYVNMDGDPTFDLQGACAAVDTGRKLAAAPARERAWLDAAASFCPSYVPSAYINAMHALAAAYPDDLDAQTMYAESLMISTRWHWFTNNVPAPGVPEAERVLKEVMRRWPTHPGANHYYIHLIESSPTPEMAIASAQRLMGIVPAAGHLLHMPGHIWLVLGDWEQAATVNERAAEVDRQYFARTNVTGGSYELYYIHNLDFIRYARSMQGRKADALRATDNELAAMAPMVAGMPEMADSFLAVPTLTWLRFGDWDRILAAPQPKDTLKVSTTFWHFNRAIAMAARGNRTGAAAERDAFEKSRAAVPPDSAWGQNRIGDVLELASESLAARLAATPAESLPHWQRAVEIQDRLTYDEPPAWYYPVRESFGAALLRAGRAADAETVFREGIRRSPRNGRMLFGLMESLRAQAKADAAEWVRREFEAVWAKADIKLRIEDL